MKSGIKKFLPLVLVNFVKIAPGGLIHQWNDLLNPTFSMELLSVYSNGCFFLYLHTNREEKTI